jgi:glycosyltransferase involved in cell wall biosynthesis
LTDLLVVSHACFTAINRRVYHLFTRDGWNLEIVAPKTLVFTSGEKNAEAPQAGDPPMHYLDLKGRNPRIYLFKQLDSLLEEKKPAIILLDNDPVSRLAIQLGKWAKKNNARLYCISNENLPLDISSVLKRRGWKAFPAAILKRIMLGETKKLVHGVFTINPDGEKIFKDIGFKNVRLIPLGFDPSFFYPDPAGRSRIRRELNLGGRVIAYFGRITPEKGIHVLIKALSSLKEYSWQLMMDSFDPSSSTYHTEITALLKEGNILDRVVFINPTHTAIAAYMNAADWIIVPSVSTPSWKEQYGRVAAEAMACGRIVVASDSGALPDLLNGFGYLFEEDNVKSLNIILEDLISGKSGGRLTAAEISDYALKNLSIYKQKTLMEEAFK